MADTKISALIDGAPVQAGDEVVVVRAGANRRVALGTAAASAASSFATAAQGTLAGTAVQPGDLIPIADGGTGLATIADAAMLATNSANVLTAVVAGASQAIRRNAGNTAWEAYTPAAGGGATLDGITAAAADQAGISNGDWNIVWNWQKTTNSEHAFTFGESAASTNGTSTSGVPNQSILKLATLAASTASPLTVYSRGNHVFSVSPSARQILAFEGSASAPSYAFTSGVNDGLYSPGGGQVAIAAGGTRSFMAVSNRLYTVDGGTNFPALGNLNDGSSGISWPSNVFTIVANSQRHTQYSAGAQTAYKGSADAVGFALNVRKSRGTAESPSVITTGDDLLTISGFGYVGATNTYQEAARITFDSTGTISDSATGIGGIMRFAVAKVGAEPVEIMRLEAGTTTGGGWLSMDEADANPGTGDLAADDAFSIYRKADKLVIAHNVGGTMNYLTIPLDGSTTTWTQGTSAP